jgi:DNA-binding IclR family transcriptional regulator
MSSVGKVFKLIEAVVAHQGTGQPFAKIVARTGIPKASAHRLLKELVDLEILTFDAETSRYRGSLKLARLGSEVMMNFNLRDYAHPFIMALHKESGHVAHLGIRNGKVGVYVDKCESRDFGIKLFSEIGKDFPLHCTAMGKVLLAHATPAEIEEILAGPLEAMTPNTITDPGKFREQLSLIRGRGYAIDRQEITRGLMCAAAPVIGIGGDVIGALSCTFPSYLESDRGIEREIEMVLRHSRKISGTLASGANGEDRSGRTDYGSAALGKSVEERKSWF